MGDTHQREARPHHRLALGGGERHDLKRKFTANMKRGRVAV